MVKQDSDLSILECYIANFILSFVCLFGIIVFNFYPKFLDYLVSVSWALEQCWVWTASCGVGPNSN